MTAQYLNYYDKYCFYAGFVFLWDRFRAKTREMKYAIDNRIRDYQRLASDDSLLVLHRQLNHLLAKAAEEWDSYDYGAGYFYQGYDKIGITGLRDSTARMKSMQLADLLKDKTVLEIGCNTGFLSCAIAETARQVDGFDINPHLIEIANLTADHLKLVNTRFETTSFEEFRPESQYDAVLSFANHSTYDGNTRQDIESYFQKCNELIKPGGMLLFESHPPEHEGDGLKDVIRILENQYAIREQRILDQGTFLDCGRTFVVAIKQ